MTVQLSEADFIVWKIISCVELPPAVNTCVSLGDNCNVYTRLDSLARRVAFKYWCILFRMFHFSNTFSTDLVQIILLYQYITY